jgi:hypothetical protein
MKVMLFGEPLTTSIITISIVLISIRKPWMMSYRKAVSMVGTMFRRRRRSSRSWKYLMRYERQEFIYEISFPSLNIHWEL